MRPCSSSSSFIVGLPAMPRQYLFTRHPPSPFRCISSSASAGPPPAGRLGKGWAEFQGSNNWDGLLDPLDPTLRSEILRYGGFVQAAYSSCNLDLSSPSYATCRFPAHSLLRLSGLPSSGYHVTRNLHATSGSRLPCWAAAAVPSFFSCRSSWIGFVAVCRDDLELARLGRRDIVISLRGTTTFLEWLDNLHATLTSAPVTPPDPRISNQPKPPMVERGFWRLFTSPGVALPSLRDQIRDEICRLLGRYGDRCSPDISITITGHSLGAALAVLAADDLTATICRAGPAVTVVSFGGPRVGNASFRRRMEEQGSRVLRIVNAMDIITKVPGFVDSPEKEGAGPNWLLSMTGWVYADIGRELRVMSRRAENVAASHDLRQYLQLVNQLCDTCQPGSNEEPRSEAGGGQRLWPVMRLNIFNTYEGSRRLGVHGPIPLGIRNRLV